MTAARQLVARVRDLVSLPETYLNISALMNDPCSTVEDFTRIVQRDPGLTAQLLRIANSAFFGVSRQVETISLAVSLMGVSRLHDLALATSLIDTFAQLATPAPHMEDFWHHSLHAGIIARMLADAGGVHGSERLFTAGLLHDIGRLAIWVAAPQHRAAVFDRASSGTSTLEDSEREILGCSHTEVAGELMRAWQFPAALTAMCVSHAAPWQSAEYTRECALVHLACTMASVLRLDPATRSPLADCEPRIIELAGLSGTQLEPIAAQSLLHLTEVAEVLLRRRTA